MEDTTKYGKFTADFSFESLALFHKDDRYSDDEIIFSLDLSNADLEDMAMTLLKVKYLREKYQEIKDDDMQAEAEQNARDEANDMELELEESKGI